jgi:hypothetical protein
MGPCATRRAKNQSNKGSSKMKAILLTAIFALSTNALATSNGTKACERFARDAVVGFVRGLDQDVALSSINLVSSYADGETANETYEVKLIGNGFSSQETRGVWVIVLNDLGSGCNFSSLSLRK